MWVGKCGGAMAGLLGGVMLEVVLFVPGYCGLRIATATMFAELGAARGYWLRTVG